MSKMSNEEFAKYLTEHDYWCKGISCKECPLEFVEGCNYDLKEWAESFLSGESAIATREEMFKFITHPFVEPGKEDMETSDRYFKELIKPIVEEMKRFYKGYMVGMAQNNQTICEPIQLPRICALVFSNVEEELNKEIKIMEYKLVRVKRKEWEDCVNDESGKYDFAFGNVFDAKTGNPVILCIEDGDEILRYKVVKE